MELGDLSLKGRGNDSLPFEGEVVIPSPLEGEG